MRKYNEINQKWIRDGGQADILLRAKNEKRLKNNERTWAERMYSKRQEHTETVVISGENNSFVWWFKVNGTGLKVVRTFKYLASLMK